MTRPLVAMVAIVKDEAHTIARTLESVIIAVDRFVVVDTGSADDTVDVIHGATGDKPLYIARSPFVDFAASRNDALDTVAEVDVSATFALMLSADETLVGGDKLRTFLESQRDTAETAFNVRVVSGDASFLYPRATRTGSSWRYEGVVHEQIVDRVNHRDGTMIPTIPGVTIEHRASDPERRLRRFREFDLPALERAVRDGKDPARRLLDMFFLAQTHESLAAAENQDDRGGAFMLHATQAMAWYMLRTDAEGDAEEWALAHFRFLKLASALSVFDDGEMVRRLSRLVAIAPKQPEASYKFAVHSARLDVGSGYRAAIAAACVARDARETPPRLPTDPSLEWRSHKLAAQCARAMGQIEAARKSETAALACGAPKDGAVV